jgi:hypothetical protein
VNDSAGTWFPIRYQIRPAAFKRVGLHYTPLAPQIRAGAPAKPARPPHFPKSAKVGLASRSVEAGAEKDDQSGRDVRRISPVGPGQRGCLADRIASATEATAKNTRQIVQRLMEGGLAFE